MPTHGERLEGQGFLLQPDLRSDVNAAPRANRSRLRHHRGTSLPLHETKQPNYQTKVSIKTIVQWILVRADAQIMK